MNARREDFMNTDKALPKKYLCIVGKKTLISEINTPVILFDAIKIIFLKLSTQLKCVKNMVFEDAAYFVFVLHSMCFYYL